MTVNVLESDSKPLYFRRFDELNRLLAQSVFPIDHGIRIRNQANRTEPYRYQPEAVAVTHGQILTGRYQPLLSPVLGMDKEQNEAKEAVSYLISK